MKASESIAILGGSPFDISIPEDEKSAIQKKIEADFDKLLELVPTVWGNTGQESARLVI